MNGHYSSTRLSDNQVKARIGQICQKYAEPYEATHSFSFLQKGTEGWFLGAPKQMISPNIKNEEINPWIVCLAPQLTPKDVFFFAYDTGISTPVLFTGGAVIMTRNKIYWKSLWGPLKHSEDLGNITGFKYEYVGPSRSGDYSIVIHRKDGTRAEIPFLADYQEDFLNEVLAFLQANP